MTPQEEIEAWKRLTRSWKEDCRRYEAMLKRVRDFADKKATSTPHPHNLDWHDISHAITSELAMDDDCPVCGEPHEADSTPIGCRTGDGE